MISLESTFYFGIGFFIKNPAACGVLRIWASLLESTFKPIHKS